MSRYQLGPLLPKPARFLNDPVQIRDHERTRNIWDAEQASENFPEDIPRWFECFEMDAMMAIEDGHLITCPEIPPGSLVRWSYKTSVRNFELPKLWTETEFTSLYLAFFAKWPPWSLTGNIPFNGAGYFGSDAEPVDTLEENVFVLRAYTIPSKEDLYKNLWSFHTGVSIQVLREGKIGWIWCEKTDMPFVVVPGDPTFTPPV